MLQGLIAANHKVSDAHHNLMQAADNYRVLRHAMAERRVVHGFVPLLFVCRRQYELHRNRSAELALLRRGTLLSDHRSKDGCVAVPTSDSVEQKSRELDVESGWISDEEEDDGGWLGWLSIWRKIVC